MFEIVDLYCERTSADFWAEPVNALTNGAFLVAAWFAWRRASSLGLSSMNVKTLLTLMISIGVGSFMFHTFATGWSRLLDVLPILLFQLLFVWVYCREIVGTSLITTLVVLVAYTVAAILGRQFSQVLNGSLIYAPALLVLLVLGVYHWATRRIEPYALLIALLVFMISLTCRAADNAVCPYFPLGIHFMWHIGNAIVLYLLMRGWLMNRHKRKRIVYNL